MDVAQDIENCLNWLHMHYAEHLTLESPMAVTKSGVLPYHPETGEILLMKPVAKKKDFAPPGWQIAKGTRMMQVEDKIIDIKSLPLDERASFVEPLACTALREGIEEVGLKLENISMFQELGVQDYASVSTGKPKQMALYLCHISQQDNFLESDLIADTTEAIAWFSLHDLPGDTRQDNLPILELFKRRIVS